MATDKDIKQFTKAVSDRFDQLSKKQLYRTNIDKYALWDKYLASFPEGTNPMFKVRTEHDCNCCKNFIRDLGNVVAIENGQIQTIWDIQVPGFYNEVAKAMAEYVEAWSDKDPLPGVFVALAQRTITDKLNKQIIKLEDMKARIKALKNPLANTDEHIPTPSTT